MWLTIYLVKQIWPSYFALCCEEDYELAIKFRWISTDGEKKHNGNSNKRSNLCDTALKFWVNCFQLKKITSRIWGRNSWNRSRRHCIDTGPTKLYYLMTWHCISWQRSIIMTSWDSLVQLTVRIHSCANCSRHAIYLKVLLISIRTVDTLQENNLAKCQNCSTNIGTTNN